MDTKTLSEEDSSKWSKKEWNDSDQDEYISSLVSQSLKRGFAQKLLLSKIIIGLGLGLFSLILLIMLAIFGEFSQKPINETLPVSREDPVLNYIEVKILKVEDSLPDRDFATTLIERVTDGQRFILKGKWGDPGEVCKLSGSAELVY